MVARGREELVLQHPLEVQLARALEAVAHSSESTVRRSYM
jgi:hypothetical protein